MALNLTGPISIGGSTVGQSINLEFGRSATQQTSMSQLYRGGGIVPNATQNANIPTSGAISLGNFYGAVNRVAISFTYAANTQQASLNVTSISGYVAGISDITVTVNSGVYLWSDNVAVAGLTLTGGTTGDTVTLVNNGFIMGRGGDGGYEVAGANGGNALSLGFNTTINNTNASAYIGGGGGGGGGSIRTAALTGAVGGAGGAGGGSGASARNGANVTGGGAGGSIGNVGNNGTATGSGVFNYTTSTGGGAGGGGGSCYVATNSGRISGAGGGRVFAGSSGSGGTISSTQSANAVTGGAGGAANAAGNSGVNTGTVITKLAGGGGGGWGASGGGGIHFSNSGLDNRPGGSGGRAVLLNGNSVTWVSGNTTRVYGAVS